jgi:hypothetical protein
MELNPYFKLALEILEFEKIMPKSKPKDLKIWKNYAHQTLGRRTSK